MNRAKEVFNELISRLQNENLNNFEIKNFRDREYIIDFSYYPTIKIEPNTRGQVFIHIDFGWRLGKYTESKRFGDKKKDGVDYESIIHYIKTIKEQIDKRDKQLKKESNIKSMAKNLIPDNIKSYEVIALGYLSNEEYQYKITSLHISLSQLQEISKILEK